MHTSPYAFVQTSREGTENSSYCNEGWSAEKGGSAPNKVEIRRASAQIDVNHPVQRFDKRPSLFSGVVQFSEIKYS